MASQDWVDKDFYAILGIAKDASDADIKKAYRKLARQHHPDTNSGDAASEKKFKDISEAYSVLSDPDERQQYDAIRAMGGGARFAPARCRAAPANGGFEDLFGGLFTGGGGRHSGGFSTAGGIPPEFADLFGGGFGGAGGQTGFQRAPQKGADRTATTSISFAGSIRGTTIGLREPNGDVIDVRVPAGIKDGQKVRVRGKGQYGPCRQRRPDGDRQRQAPRLLHARRRQPPHPRAGHLPGSCFGRRHRGSHHRRRDTSRSAFRPARRRGAPSGSRAAA